jgi:hypothetical protein
MPAAAVTKSLGSLRQIVNMDWVELPMSDCDFYRRLRRSRQASRPLARSSDVHGELKCWFYEDNFGFSNISEPEERAIVPKASRPSARPADFHGASTSHYLRHGAQRLAPYIRPSMEAFADLAERLDVLAADRAGPWWRQTARSPVETFNKSVRKLSKDRAILVGGWEWE